MDAVAKAWAAAERIALLLKNPSPKPNHSSSVQTYLLCNFTSRTFTKQSR